MFESDSVGGAEASRNGLSNAMPVNVVESVGFIVPPVWKGRFYYRWNAYESFTKNWRSTGWRRRAGPGGGARSRSSP